MDKGEELERAAHKYLWHIGYLAKSRVKFHFEEIMPSTSKTKYEGATDLDCIGYMFDQNFNETKFLIDCKHENEGKLAQILRCKGLQTIFQIDHVLLLRSKTSVRHKQFANDQGLKMMKNNDFLKIVKGFPEFGSFKKETYEKTNKLYKSVIRECKTNVVFPKDNSFLINDPFERFKQLISVFNRSQKYLLDSDLRATINPKKIILYHLFQDCILTAMEIGTRIVDTTPSKVKYDLQTRLAGDIEFKKAILKKIEGTEFADEMTFEKYSTIPIETFAPSYTDMLYDFLGFFLKNPNRIMSYLRLNDYIIHDYILHNKEIDRKSTMKVIGLTDWEMKKFSEFNHLMIRIMSVDDRMVETLLPIV